MKNPRVPSSSVALLLGLVATASGCPRRIDPPSLVAPEVLATPRDERSAAFSPDGSQVFFPIRLGDGYLQVLCGASRSEGRWSEPEVLPFSGGPAFDADPFVSADGRRLYFASSRSREGPERKVLDLWSVERVGAGWGTPTPLLDDGFKGSRRSPVVTKTGRLFFTATDEKGSRIVFADPAARGWRPAVPVDDAVTGGAQVATVAVDGDETMLVFAALGRSDEILAPGQSYPRGDLYVSFKAGGSWSAARHLGPPINTAATESAPSFSDDGRWLYFMSERGFATDQTVVLSARTWREGIASNLNGRGNIFRVEASVLEGYR